MVGDFNGLCSSNAGTWITTTTAAATGSTIFYDWKNLSWHSAGAEPPAEQKAKKPKRELSANERWLNDRVNEMRVKL